MMDPDYVLFARAVDAGSLSAAGRALNAVPFRTNFLQYIFD